MNPVIQWYTALAYHKVTCVCFPVHLLEIILVAKLMVATPTSTCNIRSLAPTSVISFGVH
jgi:hypothetical protein